MKQRLFILIIFISCTAKKPSETVIQNRMDSLTRALTDTKHEFKTTVTALSLTWYTKTEVDTKIAAAVKVANDKNTVQAAQIKSLQDSLAVMKKYLSNDFSLNPAGQVIISAAAIARIKAQVIKAP